MKNKYLLIILLALISLTYVFEEKKWHESFFNLTDRKELFNEKKLGPLRELKFKNFSLMSGNDFFTLKGAGSNIRLDQTKVEEFFKVIQSLKIKKEFKDIDAPAFIAPDMENFSLEFIFETAHVVLRIGKKSPIDGAFYLEVNDGKLVHWYLVEDVGPQPGVYEMNDTVQDTKYQRLRTFFSLPEDFFYEVRVLAQMGLSPEEFVKKVIKIELKNITNRPYQIFPQKKTTEPAPLTPLKFLDIRYQDFLKQVAELRLSQIYKVFDKKLLKDEAAKWNLLTEQGITYELVLYKKYGSLSGNFLYSENLPYLVEVLSNNAAVFFTPWQFFWDRRIVSLPDFADWGMRDEQIDFKLTKTPFVTLKVPTRKDFFIEGPTGAPPKQAEFKKLFTYFVREADRVSSMDKSLLLQVRQGRIFVMKSRGLEVEAAKVNGELVLYLPKYELYFHFFEGENLTIGREYLDYFGN